MAFERGMLNLNPPEEYIWSSEIPAIDAETAEELHAYEDHLIGWAQVERPQGIPGMKALYQPRIPRLETQRDRRFDIAARLFEIPYLVTAAYANGTIKQELAITEQEAEENRQLVVPALARNLSVVRRANQGDLQWGNYRKIPERRGRGFEHRVEAPIENGMARLSYNPTLRHIEVGFSEPPFSKKRTIDRKHVSLTSTFKFDNDFGYPPPFTDVARIGFRVAKYTRLPQGEFTGERPSEDLLFDKYLKDGQRYVAFGEGSSSEFHDSLDSTLLYLLRGDLLLPFVRQR